MTTEIVSILNGFTWGTVLRPSRPPQGHIARRRHLIHVVREQGSIAVANAQIATLVGATSREKQPDTYDAVGIQDENSLSQSGELLHSGAGRSERDDGG